VTRLWDRDAGSATVLVLGVCAVALALVTAVSALGAALAARHRAESAADLAALAAADVLAGRADGAACAAARRLVDAVGDRASLVDCRVDGMVAEVRVAVRPTGWVAALGTGTARARAGPAGGV
jgi:secretion/DNA translocation related TadE-like protein